MHHCPKCESTALTLDAHVDGQRTYSCIKCFHAWETLEISKEHMADLLRRSLQLAALERKP